MNGARRGSSSERSSWRTRIAIAFAAVVLGGFSVADSSASAIVRNAPMQAHALAPWNGVAAAKAAEAAFAASPDGDPASLPARLARRALMSDATAADALTVLGFQAQLRGDDAMADRVFAYSLKLSRRELQARLWAIEDGVRRGDIEGILDNYDIALRTSAEASRLLYPVLTSALAEPRIRQGIHGLLARNPLWTDSFINYAPRNTYNPAAVGQLFIEGAKYGLPVTSADRSWIVTGLASRGDFGDAWRYYRLSHPGITADRSRDEAFRQNLSEPSVFDWNPVTTEGRAVSIGMDQGGADFSAPGSVGGLVLQQMQVLPAGSYVLQGASEGVDQRTEAMPYFAVTCLAGRELARVPIGNSVDGPRAFTARFAVPADCAVQTLTLVLRPSDNIRGVEGRILRVSVRPAPPQRRQLP